MTDPRHRAWNDIHDLLPAGWEVGPVLFSHDPTNPVWRVSAHGPVRGRRTPPESIDVEGEDELAALTYLVLALRDYNRPGRLAEIGRRARLAYYPGAQDASFAATGEAMSAEVQDRVIERFPE